MRQIALDTETTGLEVQQGHRVIEIGAVQLLERRVTQHTFHTYLNPDRAIDEGAREVTGIADDFLLDKPRFHEVVEDFLAFIEGAELIIHNASFDVGFLDAELQRAGKQYGRIRDHAQVLDTLQMARDRYPGQRNNLDALCRRLGVDNTHRDLHGGLLDAQLLAEVYLAMTSGQVALDLAFGGSEQDAAAAALEELAPLLKRPRVLRAGAEELSAHEARLDALDKSAGGSVWRRA
ncbi:DNA polymerase III subunit epsilon [Oleiagrimonas soli]|uniref:DNA polymerase III subunit epsilon n=1 Tax=Oleiagrimonas soli TaxID=1543381 RepID=A0A099CVG4_9GAMM|nr:DNA polymerase III subunit epsilon [Oleiagrimonas soli]KGI77592.1 DNA polymerase III subunit epsilon [Oleiagrimonas soli]MBB6182919.1 DNA polymerase-3 subunit epsilon [Oleiagrimonas soli]